MIKTHILEPGSTVEFVMEGDCDIDEVLNLIRSQYCNFTKGVLWDFTYGSNMTLRADDMTRIAKTVKKHAIHKRTAYVCSEDLEFGILRMYDAFVELESIPVATKIFREREEAIQWLGRA